MALSVEKGRSKVTEALGKLVEVYELSSTSVLPAAFQRQQTRRGGEHIFRGAAPGKR